LGLFQKHGNTLLDSTMGFLQPIGERENKLAPKKGHFSGQIVSSQFNYFCKGPIEKIATHSL
jgi:hypothetical protein